MIYASRERCTRQAHLFKPSDFSRLSAILLGASVSFCSYSVVEAQMNDLLHEHYCQKRSHEKGVLGSDEVPVAEASASWLLIFTSSSHT